MCVCVCVFRWNAWVMYCLYRIQSFEFPTLSICSWANSTDRDCSSLSHPHNLVNTAWGDKIKLMTTKKPNKWFQFALVWWLLRPKCWNYEHSRLHHFQEAGVVAFPSGQVLGPENHHSHPFVSQYFFFFLTMILKYFSFLFTNLQCIIRYLNIYIYINIFFKFI